jgi:hypothetical protein
VLLPGSGLTSQSGKYRYTTSDCMSHIIGWVGIIMLAVMISLGLGAITFLAFLSWLKSLGRD